MSANQPLRILVVDDNSDCADSLAALLNLEGHSVHVAYDAVKGLRLAKEVLPHIIFHDIEMPEMDGFTAARNLRQDERLQLTMLVAVTGYGTENNVASTLMAGFDRFLMKPVKYEELLDALVTAERKINLH